MKTEPTFSSSVSLFYILFFKESKSLVGHLFCHENFWPQSHPRRKREEKQQCVVVDFFFDRIVDHVVGAPIKILLKNSILISYSVFCVSPISSASTVTLRGPPCIHVPRDNFERAPKVP